MKTKLGILVARAIIAGDVSTARALATGIWSWSVAEGRAIGGAVLEANRRYGCALDINDFWGGIWS